MIARNESNGSLHIVAKCAAVFTHAVLPQQHKKNMARQNLFLVRFEYAMFVKSREHDTVGRVLERLRAEVESALLE